MKINLKFSIAWVLFVLTLSSTAQEWPTEVGIWTWIPKNDVVCRDASTSGIGVRLQSIDTAGLMIYLQGGGACYDQESCEENANVPIIAGASYSQQRFETEWVPTFGQQGIFNTNDSTNPVAGWNHVYVPYCSGDLHGGLNTNGAVIPGVPTDETQRFVGYRNIQNILDYLLLHVPNPTDILLAGASAGGVGVLLNYPQVVEAFGMQRSVVALVDSAPIIPQVAGVRTSCFQDKLRNTFNLQLPPDCPACADTSQGGLVNLYNYLSVTKYPQGRYAFCSADADGAGVILYDRESRDCGGAGVSIFSYRQILYILRDEYIGYDFATFLPGGVQHTMTQSNELWLERKYQGTSGSEWFGRINEQLNGGAPYHVPPANLKPTDEPGDCGPLGVRCDCGFFLRLFGLCCSGFGWLARLLRWC